MQDLLDEFHTKILQCIFPVDTVMYVSTMLRIDPINNICIIRQPIFTLIV